MFENGLQQEYIPRLEHSSNYRQWRKAIKVEFLRQGCQRVINGTAVEPFRNMGSKDKVEISREVLAGTAPPTPTEAIGGVELNKNQLFAWKEWQQKEQTAQRLILSTVEEELSCELEQLKSALDMWTYLKKKLGVTTEEYQEEIEIKLKSIKLRERPTPKEMENHLISFSELLSEARESECGS
ncbi:hypothetical protein L204_102488 [Cryptococcus depauperatus]